MCVCARERGQEKGKKERELGKVSAKQKHREIQRQREKERERETECVYRFTYHHFSCPCQSHSATSTVSWWSSCSSTVAPTASTVASRAPATTWTRAMPALFEAGCFKVGILIDWCCFHDSIRHNSVALLEVLFARNLFNLSCQFFSCFLCVWLSVKNWSSGD